MSKQGSKSSAAPDIGMPEEPEWVTEFKSEAPPADHIFWPVIRYADACRAYALSLREREEKVRRLLASDSWCPACGHNRDTSSVSSIDNEDGTRACQLCGVNWIEVAAAPSAGGEEK